MNISTVSRPLLSSFNGKPILLGFNVADMSFGCRVDPVREVERRDALAGELAYGIIDPLNPEKVRHSLGGIVLGSQAPA